MKEVASKFVVVFRCFFGFFFRLGNTTSLQMLGTNMALFGTPTPKNLKPLQSERKFLEKIFLNIFPNETICIPARCKAKVAKIVHIAHVPARKTNLKKKLTLRMLGPQTGYFEKPDPCYTGSNPSIGGSHDKEKSSTFPRWTLPPMEFTRWLAVKVHHPRRNTPALA